MVKSQSACYIFTHEWGIISLIVPSTSLRPVVEIWVVIVLRASMMIAATAETVYTSLKYGHVDYTINFISVKNSEYQL